MKKIQATVDPYSQSAETTASEISAMAKAMVSGAGAEVVRDANGKVIQVIVGVPDFVADGTVGNAANAIGAHGGVAVVKTLAVPVLKAKSITKITEGVTTNETYSTLPDGCVSSFWSVNPATIGTAFPYTLGLCANRPTGVASNVGPQITDLQWNYGKLDITGQIVPDPSPVSYPIVLSIFNYSQSVYGANLVDVNILPIIFKLDYANDINNSNIVNVNIPATILKTTDIMGPQEPMCLFYIDQNGTATRLLTMEEFLQKLQGQ